MKKIAFLLFITLLSCNKEVEKVKSETNSIKQKDSISSEILPPAPEIKTETENETEKGDFDGDGLTDTATAILTKKGEGNPQEDGTPDEYTITFSDKKFPALPIGCCYAILINEGDLDNNGTDEFSVLQAPQNGCMDSMTTFTFKNGKWQQLIESFLIPNACDGFTEDEIQNRVFLENGKLYFMENDLDSEDFILVKKEAVLKTTN